LSSTGALIGVDTGTSEARRPDESPSRQGILHRFVRRPVAFASFVFVVGIIVVCAGARWFAPYPPLATDFSAILTGPSVQHLLGTDELGRDTLSRLLYGGQPMLLAMAEATAIAVSLGTALGILAGYKRGWADRILSGWGDLLLAMPVLVILIVVISVFPSSLYPTMLPLGVLLSAGPMRVVRSATLGVREELYIDAARVVGLSHRRVMTRHVLPRLWGPIVVQATLVSAESLVTASGIAFLGFGINAPAPSWGSMVADAATQYQRQAWLLVPSGGIIALMVLALGLLGDGVADLVDERWIGSAVARVARRSRRVRSRSISGARRAAAPAGTPPGGDGSGLILSARDVSVGFGDGRSLVTVVDQVSFDLYQGRTLALVGESGCGKSMTARAILGVLPAGGRILDGSIRLGPTELIGASRAVLGSVRGRRIGFVGQEPHASLDPAQTIGSSLREVLRRYDRTLSRSGAKHKVLDHLARVRLEDPERVAGSFPHQLSGGMAQRVAIARALAGEPEILIADEPTTALDVTVQAEILALLRSLQMSTGVAILFITHDWGVVATLADDVVVMYAGQVVEQADAASAFDRPMHPYTEALLASDPHRAVAGQVLPTIGGAVPAPGSWPRGCRFAPRCRYASAECASEPIELVGPEQDRLSRCIHVDLLVSCT
jgi:peptide/nickel transport system permease protein